MSTLSNNHHLDQYSRTLAVAGNLDDVPLVFVILFRNQVHRIQRCLDSMVAMPTSATFGFIVSDDDSNDGSIKTVLRHEALDRFPHVVVQNRKRLASAHNLYRSLRLLNNPETVIAELDGDDELEPGRDVVKESLDKFDEGFYVVFGGFDIYRFGERTDGDRFPLDARQPWMGEQCCSWIHFRSYKKHLIDKVGIEYFKERDGTNWLSNNHACSVHAKLIELAGPERVFRRREKLYRYYDKSSPLYRKIDPLYRYFKLYRPPYHREFERFKRYRSYEVGVRDLAGINADSLAELPGISCLVVTHAKKVKYIPDTIYDFARQSWDRKQLVLVHDSGSTFHEYLWSVCKKFDVYDAKIVMVEEGYTLGQLRNISVENAAFDLVVQWDDDDRYHKDRLYEQAKVLMNSGSDICLLRKQLCFNVETSELYISDWSARQEIDPSLPVDETYIPGTVMIRKRLVRYADKRVGEDSSMLKEVFYDNKVCAIDNKPWLYIYRYVGTNAWPAEHHARVPRLTRCRTDRFIRLRERVRNEAEKTLGASFILCYLDDKNRKRVDDRKSG